MSDAIIGTLHWDACDTCVNDEATGCCQIQPSLENYLGDYVTCADYEATA